MSNTQGLLTPNNPELNALLKAIEIDQDPKQEGKLDIVQSKEVISWAAELVAEILYTVKKQDVGKGLGGLFAVVARFADDLFAVAPIINKFSQLVAEAKDWDDQEKLDLQEWADVETARAFGEKSLPVYDNSTKLVVDLMGLIIKLIAVASSIEGLANE